MGSDLERRTDDSTLGTTRVADGVLLDQFIHEHNQQAFAALMERHGPYLLGVCRRATANLQDAEDIFQACFLELVRHGASIRQRNSVGGWLQTVAVRLAGKARARQARRQRREAEGARKEAVGNPADVSWREVRGIVEEELARLPERLKSPIILCLFQGRTRDEAAQYLEVSTEVLKHRLKRGREMLQKRLTRRGVSLAALGALLSGEGAQAAVPVSLSLTTLNGASAMANKAALAPIVTPSVMGLLGSTGIGPWGVLAWSLAGLLLAASAAYIGWDRFAPTPPPPAPVRIAGAKLLQKVHRSFRGKQFDPQFFRWTGPKKYTRFEEEGLRIILPAEKGPTLPVGVMMRHPVRGDFEVEATFEILHLPPSPDSVHAFASVYLFMPSVRQDGVWIGRVHDPKLGPAITLGQRVTDGTERSTRNYLMAPADAESPFVRLRIERQGILFHLLVGEGEAGDFQHLESLAISDEPVQIVRFAAHPVLHPNLAVDVRLVEMSIAAEEIVGYEPK